MSDVFISYKREDRLRVETLAGILVDLGLDVWFDAGIDVGEAWAHRIERELAASAAIIVCWTPAACASEWVLREARHGLDRAILVPLLFAPCMPQACEHLQVADLISWRGELDHGEFNKVLRALEGLTGKTNLSRAARSRAGGQHEDVVAILRHMLVERARSRKKAFTYGEAEKMLRERAEASGVVLHEFNQLALWGALETIAEQNRSRREPLLPALIVSAETGIPGRGYFQKNAFIEGVGGDLEKRVHRRQLRLARAHGWPQDP